MTEQQAMRMALEAFEEIIHWYALRDRNDVLLNFVDQNPEIKKAMQAITALRQALEQQDGDCQRCGGKGCVACDARKQQPADEPVAWGTRERFYEAIDRAVENTRQEMQIKAVTMRCKNFDIALPILDAYMGHVLVGEVATRPQPAAWVGLTDEELEPLCDEWRIVFGSWTYDFARAIEAKLKEKNNG